jgi:hypothetical protein
VNHTLAQLGERWAANQGKHFYFFYFDEKQVDFQN